MSFSRARRPPIAGDPNPNFHHHYRFNPAAMATTSSRYGSGYSRKQNRDRGFVDPDAGAAAPPPLKRRRPDAAEVEEESRRRQRRDDRGRLPEVELTAAEAAADFMSRDEIERCSPSRKDGIDVLMETHLRYSYCSYLQSLGMRLELPQTTTGTAMVLCHRFFVRRSHASHDRFLVATAALFLATKSEETPCLLNTVLRASCEVCQKHNFAFFPYLVYSHDWFDQYRERVIEAEQMILTTLDFELDVHHPYVPLTSVLSKLGFSQTALLNLAWNVVSEGIFLQEYCAHLCDILSWRSDMLFMESIFFSSEVEQLASFGWNHIEIQISCCFKWLLNYFNHLNSLASLTLFDTII